MNYVFGKQAVGGQYCYENQQVNSAYNEQLAVISYGT